MGLTVVKRLAVDRRLKVPASNLEDEGVAQFIVELRDLAPPFRLHNHISAAVWFAVRYAYEQERFRNVSGAQNTYGQQHMQRYNGPYYGGRPPAVMAYKAFGFQPWSHYEDVLERERRKEEELFVQALRGRR